MALRYDGLQIFPGDARPIGYLTKALTAARRTRTRPVETRFLSEGVCLTQGACARCHWAGGPGLADRVPPGVHPLVDGVRCQKLPGVSMPAHFRPNGADDRADARGGTERISGGCADR